MSLPIKSKDLLKSFTSYCRKHPEERFWQALRNWNMEKNPKEQYIVVAHAKDDNDRAFQNCFDTFYREK